MPDILQVTVPNGNASIVWSSRDTSVTSLLFINQDLNNTVWLGSQSTITPGSPNTIPLAPNGTFSGSASSVWYVTGSAAGIQPLVVVPNGQAYFLGLTQGLGKLAIPQIQSPDYVPGVSGWAVFKDGSAEFNNVTIRGSEVIDGSALYYNPSPGAGDLIASVDKGVSGNPYTDPYGNLVLPGLTSYSGAQYAQLFDGNVELGAISGGSPVPVYVVGPNGITEWNVAVIPPSGDATGATDLARINSQLTSGRAVRLLPGTYYINGPIVIPAGGSLSGPPSGYDLARTDVMPVVIKLVAGSNSNMVSVKGNNYYVGDLELDGQKALQTGGSGACILINGASYGHVNRVSTHDSFFRGIELTNLQGAKISKCVISNNNDTGLYVDTSATDNLFESNVIADNTNYGIFLLSYLNHIQNNDIYQNGKGIYVNGGLGSMITNNGVDRNQQEGIYVAGTAGNVAIIGNSLHSNSQQANNTYSSIFIDNGGGNVTGCSVEGNQFWLDGAIVNLVKYHIQYNGTVVTKAHGNQFRAGSYVTGTISAASQVKDPNETG